jgi:adenosylcobinamide-phosphate synthase
MSVGDGAAEALLLPLAIAWDLLLGEPPARVHPVVWMGKSARALERHAPAEGAAWQLAYGALLAAGPPLAYAAIAAWGRERLRDRPLLALALGVPALKSTFAIRELRHAGEGVRAPLATGDLAAARAGLRSLVSRDPSGLDAPLVAAAAVESLAENLGDSIVAPFLAWALGGLPGAVAYRAVNTLDAMIGYRGRYEWLGKGAARLDDALNLVPARLAALLLVAAALVAGEDPRGALATARRDARLTASPNAGWTMAAMAGALGVELEKVGHYRLGAGGAPCDATTIARADRLVTIAAGGAAALALGLRLALARRGSGGRRWRKN